jgi:CRISPR-associated protein Cmr4
MATRLVLVHALSPLHAGTGQSVGAIDLPIARERPTGIPLVPGSSIKGALRARSGKNDPLTRDVFGPETAQSSEHAGSVQLSDAHLVLLPVRSVAGTFAWTTSPYLLRRFVRDAREAGLSLPLPPIPAGPDRCTVLADTLTLPQGDGRRVVLEDLDFQSQTVAGDSPLATLAAHLGRLLFPDGSPETAGWRQSLKERICLVHDDIMSLLLETATEVAARVRLNEETKTVAKGALWYEESLPAESILAGLAVAWDIQGSEGNGGNGGNGRTKRTGDDLLRHLESLTGSMVQLGGKANVGRGSCLLRLGGAA